MIRLATIGAEPVELTIGGVEYLAPKLRVRDISYLESWFAAVMATPSDGPEELTPDELEPRMGSPIATRLLGSPEGIARVVHASLRQVDPSLMIRGARELAGRMTPGEIARFFVAVFPRASGQERPRDGRPMDWHGGILHLAAGVKKVATVAECLDMPLDLFFSLFEEPGQGGRGHGPRKRWDIPLDPNNVEAQINALMAEYQQNGTVKHPRATGGGGNADSNGNPDPGAN